MSGKTAFYKYYKSQLRSDDYRVSKTDLNLIQSEIKGLQERLEAWRDLEELYRWKLKQQQIQDSKSSDNE
jgi:hypothetical protein